MRKWVTSGIAWMGSIGILILARPVTPILAANRGEVVSTPRQSKSPLDSAKWWSEADPSYGIEIALHSATVAYNSNITSLPINRTTRPLFFLKPGQTIDINAIPLTRKSLNQTIVDIQPSQWQIANVTSGVNTLRLKSGYLYTPKAPGVYVIRYTYQGRYSTPIVLVVGLHQLRATVHKLAPSVVGVEDVSVKYIQSKYRTLKTGWIHHGDFGKPVKGYTITSGSPKVGSWIPIYGRVDPKTFATNPDRLIHVELIPNSLRPTNPDYAVQSYLIQVSKSGRFSAMVWDPLAGPYDLTITSETSSKSDAKQELQAIADASTAQVFETAGAVHSVSPAPNNTQATGVFDYTVDPGIAQLAWSIYYNSPDPESGLAAISNFVSSRIAYDDAEFNLVGSIMLPANEIYEKGAGVCENYADLLTSVYRSIGISAVRVGGVIQYGKQRWTPHLVKVEESEGNAHTWVQAWYAPGKTMVTDPTWNIDVDGVLSNDYMTDTTWMKITHFAESVPTHQ